MDNKSTQFSSFLKNLMRHRNLRPVQLSVNLDVSHATVSRWLNNKNLPDIQSCWKIAKYYHEPLEKVLSSAGYIPEITGAEAINWPSFREYAQIKYPEDLDDDMIVMVEDLIERRRDRRLGNRK